MGCTRPAGSSRLASGKPPLVARARVTIVIVRSNRGYSPEWLQLAACSNAPGASCISADPRAPGRPWATKLALSSHMSTARLFIGSIMRAPLDAIDHHRSKPSLDPILHGHRSPMLRRAVCGCNDGSATRRSYLRGLTNSDPKARSVLHIREEGEYQVQSIPSQQKDPRPAHQRAQASSGSDGRT